MNYAWSFFALVCAASLSAADLPNAEALKISQLPKLDGKLDEPFWKDAKPLAEFHLLDGTGARSDQTRAYLAFDNRWLFIGVACDNSYPTRMPQTIFEHDAGVNQDDSVEIFLDPGTGGATYYHLLLSFANVKAEQRVAPGQPTDRAWDAPWLSATCLTTNGWTAEMAIPLSNLASYGDPARARINICRNAVIAQVDPQAMTYGYKRTSSSWAPIVKSFHEPDRFGAVRGIEKDTVQPVFLASFTKAEITEYRLIEGKFSYDVLFKARSLPGPSGKVRVIVRDQPTSGEAGKVVMEQELEADARRDIKVTVPVAVPTARTVDVSMEDAASGGTFRADRVRDTAALNLMTSYLDRNYYTSEKEGVAMVALGIPAGKLAGMALVVRDKDGRELGTVSAVEPRMPVRFALEGLSNGEHTVAVELRNEKNETIFGQEHVLIKRAPKPGFEWKVDRVNKVVLREGKPFFPIGIIMSGTGTNAAAFREVAEAGFDTVQHWESRITVEELAPYYRMAEEHGLLVSARPEAVTGRPLSYPPECVSNGLAPVSLAKYIPEPSLQAARKLIGAGTPLTQCKGALVVNPLFRNLALFEKTEIFNEYYSKNEALMLEVIRVSRDHRNVIAYTMFDEPFELQFDSGRIFYNKLNALDGYRPCWVTAGFDLGQPAKETAGWDDIVNYDPYWSPPSDEVTVNKVITKVTQAVALRGEHFRKPNWMVIEANGFGSGGGYKRRYLPREQFVQTYLTLIHGAKGLLFFRYPGSHRQNWEDLVRVVKELKVLGPACVTPDIPQTIAYQTAKAGPIQDGYPDVQVALRRNPDGGQVLLAANTRPYPVNATFRMSCFNDVPEVKRLFAKDRYRVKEGAFSERLEPYATRAYTFDGKLDAARPVEIAVSGEALSDRYKPEEVLPMTGRPDRKNVLRNPGFEEASLPLYPDYYRTMNWEPIPGGPLIGDPDCGWSMDSNKPYEGKFCMRIVTAGPWSGVLAYCAPQHDRPIRYVFSAWIKADRDGMGAELCAADQKQSVKLTTEWKRYHVTFMLPARADNFTGFGPRATQAGTLWVDAMQLERGETPTDYEP